MERVHSNENDQNDQALWLIRHIVPSLETVLRLTRNLTKNTNSEHYGKQGNFRPFHPDRKSN